MTSKTYSHYLSQARQADHYVFEPSRPLGRVDFQVWSISRPQDPCFCPIKLQTDIDLVKRQIIYDNNSLTVRFNTDWNETEVSWVEPPWEGRRSRRSYHAIARPWENAWKLLVQNDQTPVEISERLRVWREVLDEGEGLEIELQDVFYRRETTGDTNTAGYRRGNKDKKNYTEPREPDNPDYMKGFNSDSRISTPSPRKRALSSYGRNSGRIKVIT